MCSDYDSDLPPHTYEADDDEPEVRERNSNPDDFLDPVEDLDGA